MAVTTREKIEAAFADVPYPGDENIAEHEDCLECDDVRALFRGKSWRALSMKELRGEWSALNFFSKESLQYFLPAYMIASLGRWEEADLIPEWILYRWLPMDEDETESLRKYQVERQSIFTHDQREAIAAYLDEYREYVKELPIENDIRAAIDILVNGAH